jgi:hypothetical protein
MIGKTNFSHDVHIRCCPFSPSIKVSFQDFGPAAFEGKRLLKVCGLLGFSLGKKKVENWFIKRRKGKSLGLLEQCTLSRKRAEEQDGIQYLPHSVSAVRHIYNVYSIDCVSVLFIYSLKNLKLANYNDF